MLHMEARRKECVAFGAKIGNFRKKLKKTQEDLAYEAHIDRAHLHRIEQGKRAPSLTMILKIALALKVPPARLIDYSLREVKEFFGKG
jgi:XRE family transcriptional regulator, regulator of sulfur utilization